LATANETLFFEYAEQQGWSQRLRRITPEGARALRDLFHNRESLTLDGTPKTTWQFAPAASMSPPAAVLDGVHEKLSLIITNDGWCDRLGAREWWDFSGESRLLAWALAHTGLLEGLGRILREPLMPSALTDGIPPEADTNIALAFSAVTADGKKTTGCVSLSPALVARLASFQGWQRSAPAANPWLKLPARLHVELRGMSFPLGVLRASEMGDVLILGDRATCWANLQVTLGRTRVWSATYDGKRLVATERAPNTTLELIMSDPNAAGAADQIPVSLDFDLGNLAVPLGELATLKPGYVFELPNSLDSVRVVIRANGTRVGHGELVAVGDVLGVQLLALETDGLR
jgi:type III secretion system YscQ/HrcQ family protein